MTVRAWFTISALCLLALGVAVAVRFFSPLQPPELMVNAGDVRLEGAQQSYCWPQRNGDAWCEENDDVPDPDDVALPATGSMRIVAIYPVQPEDGSIQVLSGADGEVVTEEEWTDRFHYDLEPGRYLLFVEGRYQADAFVRYTFGFRVPNPGG